MLAKSSSHHYDTFDPLLRQPHYFHRTLDTEVANDYIVVRDEPFLLPGEQPMTTADLKTLVTDTAALTTRLEDIASEKPQTETLCTAAAKMRTSLACLRAALKEREA